MQASSAAREASLEEFGNSLINKRKPWHTVPKEIHCSLGNVGVGWLLSLVAQDNSLIPLFTGADLDLSSLV